MSLHLDLVPPDPAAGAESARLDQPAWAHLVAGAPADLFLVTDGADGAGDRSFLFTVEPGTLLPGLAPGGPGALLAVALPGARLIRLRPEELPAAGRAEAAAAFAAAAAQAMVARPAGEQGPASAAPADRLMRWAVALAQQERERERAWLSRRLEAERARTGDALADAASAVGHVRADAPPAEAPLLEACRLIGFRFTGAPPAARDPVAAMAAAAGVPHRRVALRGDWWLGDAGPLLAFRREDGRPVALLPRRGGYLEADPTAGTRRPVDRAAAAALHPRGHAFYHPLPARALTVLDLLRLGPLRERRLLLRVLLCGVGGGLLGLGLPLATAHVFAGVLARGGAVGLAAVFAGLAVAATAALLLDLAGGFAFLAAQGKAASAIQAALLHRLARLPTAFFRRYPVGDLVSRLQGLMIIRTLLSGGLTGFAIAALTGIFNTALLFYFHPGLALAATLLLLAGFGVIAVLLAAGAGARYQAEERAGGVAGLVVQLITGIGKLRVSAAERRAFGEWLRRYTGQVRHEMRSARLEGGAAVVAGVLPPLATLVVFACAAGVLQGGEPLDSARFIGFTAALGMLLTTAAMALWHLASLLQVVPYLRRLRPLLVEVPEPSPAGPDGAALAGRVEATRIVFRYEAEGRPVLDDVSFEAHPGEHVAVVGPSGSGKSTLLRLLLGFERPESGAIHYDRRDLASLNLTRVRQQLGVVLQSSRLIGGDIFDNIAGSALLTPDEVWEAAELAGVADDIRAMPMGLHTHVSEVGSTLSGGQAQRILIARALVRRPRILLLDEATSALDNLAQRAVSDAVARLRATRISIAHRLSTIREADRIYVLVEGRVAEVGRFEELMAAGGVFARLAARQLT